VTLPTVAGTLATTTGAGSVFTNPTINGFTGDTSAITIGTTQFVKDTSGNIGIGTASPSTYGKFVVNNSAASNSTVLTQALLTNRSYSTSNNGLSIVAATSNGTLGTHDFGAITFNEAPISNGGSAYVNMYVGGASSSYGSNPRFLQAYSSGGSGWADYVALWAGGYERARIDSSGNLVVGGTNVGGRVTVFPATTPTTTVGANQICIGEATQNTNYRLQLGYCLYGGAYKGTIQSYAGGSAADLVLCAAGGNLSVGTTSVNPVGDRTNGLVLQQTGILVRGVTASSYFGLNATSGTHIIFYTDNGSAYVTAGSISSSGGTTLYNATSDQRLKENIVDAPNALSSINAIKVRSFDWKADGSHSEYGYIAQELLEVAPEAVHVPVDPEEMMGVDFGKLTPRLVKAIQELSAQNQALEARLATLEAK
jgi:hypothetical protein